ncbi:MAG: hypothetical protein PHX19_03880 [Bacilli bacterium]|jgi:hypothetical protein|nr:hypothetical protein [Bacilli bacterium]
MFLTISEENITTLIGYMSGLITDLLPLILVILGISIAIFIFRSIAKN